MMSKNKQIIISEFYCTNCGRRGIPLARKIGQVREAGHLKRLYCPYCRREVNHAEVRPFGNYNYEDFQKEFELGRFIDGERIPISELDSCTEQECKYNQNGKCWNATKDFDCKHRLSVEQTEKENILKENE